MSITSIRSITSVTQRLRSEARRALCWPVASQEVARRNAMLAGTVLTQRRVERLEVEAFLAAYLETRATRASLVQRAG